MDLSWEIWKENCESSRTAQAIPLSSERKAMVISNRLPFGRNRLFVKRTSKILTKKCTRHTPVFETPSIPKSRPRQSTKSPRTTSQGRSSSAPDARGDRIPLLGFSVLAPRQYPFPVFRRRRDLRRHQRRRTSMGHDHSLRI